MNELWTTLARRAGIELDSSQHEKLSRFLDLLLAANEKMNLTRITDRAAAQVQHVGDALTLLPFLPPAEIVLADVGSGGGVPGIPLAIARPNAQVMLVESTKKKAAFLRDVVREMSLPNVKVSDSRAEEIARGQQRESFDVVTARAVGALVWLVEWCLPLTKKGGKILAMKGAKVHEEIPAAQKAIKLLGGGEPVVHPVELPGTEHHVIVEIPKISRTDAKFPRDPTRTRGNPIG